ncbi:hypothetical protein AHAS_Ahas15G0173500 [Arachis hypogaea]
MRSLTISSGGISSSGDDLLRVLPSRNLQPVHKDFCSSDCGGTPDFDSSKCVKWDIDVHKLPEVLRIVVNFDRQRAAIGEAAGLLAGVRFCFKVCDSLAKQFLLQSLGEKWREHRIKLWNEFYDLRLSKTEIINSAKSIARRRAELTEETEKEVSRVQIWDITHKKIDESYINEKAKKIAFLGIKEHPGRVRGLDMGAVPTVAFKNNITRINQMNLGPSNDAGTSSTCGLNVQEELDTVKSQL